MFRGKRVLCWEPAPYPVHIALVASTGAALALRGCDVELVICDGTPVACIGREVNNEETFADWPKRCSGCYAACTGEASLFNMKTEGLGDLVASHDLARLRDIARTVDLAGLPQYVYKDINVGAYTLSAAVRYYQGKVTEYADDLLREFLFAALVTTEAALNKIETFKPDAIYMSHGMYTGWGPALAAAMQRGVPVVKFGGGYKKGCLHFHKIAAPTTNFHFGVLSNRGWKTRCDQPLSAWQERLLDDYLESRYLNGSSAFFDITASVPLGSRQHTLSSLGLSAEKPVWCIFSHVTWDNAVNLTSMAFSDFNQWIVETLKTIVDIPDVQWLLKIHPAEKIFGVVDGVEKTVASHFTELPGHIKIIPPDAHLNLYDLLGVLTGGVTCLGTVGLELAMMGKPVIVAADAYYSGKGFTCDGLTPVTYRDLLKKAPGMPPSLNAGQKQKARQFAYSYFIQRQIPMTTFRTGSNGLIISFDWRKAESLLPGKDMVVDMVCQRFFDGDDFILPDVAITDMMKR